MPIGMAYFFFYCPTAEACQLAPHFHALEIRIIYVPIQFIDYTLVHNQWNYIDIAQSEPLQPFVACYWFLNSISPLREVVPHRVLPDDGYVDILLDLTAGGAHLGCLKRESLLVEY